MLELVRKALVNNEKYIHLFCYTNEYIQLSSEQNN